MNNFSEILRFTVTFTVSFTVSWESNINWSHRPPPKCCNTASTRSSPFPASPNPKYHAYRGVVNILHWPLVRLILLITGIWIFVDAESLTSRADVPTVSGGDVLRGEKSKARAGDRGAVALAALEMKGKGNSFSKHCPLPLPSELKPLRARSRLYRSRFLQAKTYFTGLFVIYKFCALLHSSNLKI